MYDADHQCRLQYGTDDAEICTNKQVRPLLIYMYNPVMIFKYVFDLLHVQMYTEVVFPNLKRQVFPFHRKEFVVLFRNNENFLVGVYLRL